MKKGKEKKFYRTFLSYDPTTFYVFFNLSRHFLHFVCFCITFNFHANHSSGWNQNVFRFTWKTMCKFDVVCLSKNIYYFYFLNLIGEREREKKQFPQRYEKLEDKSLCRSLCMCTFFSFVMMRKRTGNV